MYGAPAQRSDGVEARFEYHGWRPSAAAVDLHAAAATDIKKAALNGKLALRARTHDLLIDHAREYDHDDQAADDQSYSFDPSQHVPTPFLLFAQILVHRA